MLFPLTCYSKLILYFHHNTQLFYVTKMKVTTIGPEHYSVDPTFWTSEKISQRIRAEKKLSGWCLGLGEPQIYPVRVAPPPRDHVKLEDYAPFLYWGNLNRQEIERLCERLPLMSILVSLN